MTDHIYLRSGCRGVEDRKLGTSFRDSEPLPSGKQLITDAERHEDCDILFHSDAILVTEAVLDDGLRAQVRRTADAQLSQLVGRPEPEHGDPPLSAAF